MTHFFVRIFKLLLRENHPHYLNSDNMQFFIKLLMKKESENIQVQLVVLEIFSKMLNKVKHIVNTAPYFTQLVYYRSQWENVRGVEYI